jgi:hypothetical protein
VSCAHCLTLRSTQVQGVENETFKERSGPEWEEITGQKEEVIQEEYDDEQPVVCT